MQFVSQKEIKLRVFERGVGETLACGSGACAAMVAGRKVDLLHSTVVVNQPGGELTVSWLGKDESVEMTGPARTVYHGEWPR